MPVKAKKKPWFAVKIEELEKQIEEQGSGGDVDIDSYCKGFYDCMSKYAIFAKGARRRIVQTIRERYKGNNDTKFVWRVK